MDTKGESTVALSPGRPTDRMTIDTTIELHDHLQRAMELEHATLPPHLYALWSIRDGENTAAAAVMRHVVLEKLLHLTHVANLINAIGGSPTLHRPKMLPSYPTRLPHVSQTIELSLRRFSPEALQTFLAIARPETHDGLPADDRFTTIDQFYDAAEDAFVRLTARLGEDTVFCGDPARQVTCMGCARGTEVIAVTDLASAMAAVGEIVEPGRGIDHQSVLDGHRSMFDPATDNVSTYFRLQELRIGRRYVRGDTPAGGPTGPELAIDWAGVHPIATNPRSGERAVGSATRSGLDAFNRSYCKVLELVELALNGHPALLAAAVTPMAGLNAEPPNP